MLFFRGGWMKELIFKTKTFLVMGTVLLAATLCFCDSNTLNHVFLGNNDFDIKTIAMVNTNKGSADTQLLGNVVVNNPDPVNPATVSAQTDYWAWPTAQPYMITSTFGYRWGSNHDAVDISGPGYGSPIYAANSGVVKTVRGGCVPGNTGCNGRGGNYIIINHNSNNYYTIYMHLKDINVSEGQVVSRGQVIGTMGNTGNVVPVPTAGNPTGGTHLHFGLYIGEPYNGGYAVNPMRLY